MEQPDDPSLLQAVARRDREAFEALYYRYAPRLGRYAFKLLQKREAVDEVINDVMLTVWQDAARFDGRVGTVSAWLFGITHKKVLKMLEQSRKHAHTEAPEVEAKQPDPQQDPERDAMGRQLGAAMTGALAKLPAEQRAVVELAFGEGQSYQEIADALDCPVNTVKTRMFHARKRLADFLGSGLR